MLLSIVITAHNEGLLIHKTLLSIRDAVRNIDKKDFELIVHVDNGRGELLNYLKDKERHPISFKVFHNTFGDLGQSRNFCSNVANGKYIFFIDADDLISDNFLTEALRVLKNKKENVFLHPEYCLSFRDTNDDCWIWQMNAGKNYNDDVYALFERNLWISSIIGEKKLFMSYSYPTTENGFGCEDYAFNIQTLSNNIRHDIVPNTTHFYRQKDYSLLTSSNNDLLTQRKNDLFNFSRWSKMNYELELPEVTSKENVLANKCKKIYYNIRSNKISHAITSPAIVVAKKFIRKKAVTTDDASINPSLLKQWKKIGRIEKHIQPTDSRIKQITYYNPRLNNKASYAYQEISKQNIPDETDYVFLLSNTDISEDDILNKILKLCNNSKHKITIISTGILDKSSIKIADNVAFIDFYEQTKLLEDYEKEILLTRLMVQLNAKKIFVFNSIYSYRWIIQHRELVTKNYRLNVILSTKSADSLSPYIINIYGLIDKCYIDDNNTGNYLTSNYGFKKEKLFLLSDFSI